MTQHDSHQALIQAALDETNPTRKSQIIEELGTKGVVEAIPFLIELIQRGDYQSGAAIAALGHLGGPQAIDTLVECFGRQNQGWIAKDALVQIGEPALGPTSAAVWNRNPDVRFMAIRTLGELGLPQARLPLQEAADDDLDETNRKLARSVHKQLMLSFLRSTQPETRLEGVHGLAWLADTRTVDVLLTVADGDPDEQVRATAMQAIPHLLQSVEQDPFAGHKLAARSPRTDRMIGELQNATGLRINRTLHETTLEGDAQALAALQAAAESHPDDAVRQQATAALIYLCIDLLRQSDAEARLIAVNHLAQIDDAHSQRLLEQVAAHDPNEAVRHAAGG